MEVHSSKDDDGVFQIEAVAHTVQLEVLTNAHLVTNQAVDSGAVGIKGWEWSGVGEARVLECNQARSEFSIGQVLANLQLFGLSLKSHGTYENIDDLGGFMLVQEDVLQSLIEGQVEDRDLWSGFLGCHIGNSTSSITVDLKHIGQ